MCNREYPQKSAKTFQSRLRATKNQRHDTTQFLSFRCISFIQGYHRYLGTPYLASEVVPAGAAGVKAEAGVGVRAGVQMSEPIARGIATGGGRGHGGRAPITTLTGRQECEHHKGRWHQSHVGPRPGQHRCTVPADLHLSKRRCKWRFRSARALYFVTRANNLA